MNVLIRLCMYHSGYIYIRIYIYIYIYIFITTPCYQLAVVQFIVTFAKLMLVTVFAVCFGKHF